MTTTTAAPAITDTRAALLILEHAERTGLPLPHGVQVAEYLGSVYGASIDFMFASLADLTDWAQWMEVAIEETVREGCVILSATGDALDARVRCVVVQLVAGAS
jgi:hypothetical protein